MVRFLDLLRLATEAGSPPVRIGRISAALARHLGANTTVVRLSHQTLIKQLLRHPDLRLEDYVFVDHVLSTGTVIAVRTGSLAFVHAPVGKQDLLPFKVVVKVTVDGDLYMTTFHRLRQAEVRRILKQGRILRTIKSEEEE